MLRIQTILHPTDFSRQSEFAFQLACSIASDYGARLIVVHVAEAPSVAAAEGVLMYPTDYDLEPIRTQLKQLRPQNSNVQVEHRLIEGTAAADILEVANATRCDLIVMGTHGRTGLGRLLMGSVAEQVVRKAACPVLTVKTPVGSASMPEEAAVALASGQ
jgi:nucleotide-binding universal stress UspA family protein